MWPCLNVLVLLWSVSCFSIRMGTARRQIFGDCGKYHMRKNCGKLFIIYSECHFICSNKEKHVLIEIKPLLMHCLILPGPWLGPGPSRGRDRARGQVTRHNSMIKAWFLKQWAWWVAHERFNECQILLSLNAPITEQKIITINILQVGDGRIEISDPELRRQVNPTTADLRFADFLVKYVTDEKGEVFLDDTGQFYTYILL